MAMRRGTRRVLMFISVSRYCYVVKLRRVVRTGCRVLRAGQARAASSM
jgi:hypothetical protein